MTSWSFFSPRHGADLGRRIQSFGDKGREPGGVLEQDDHLGREAAEAKAETGAGGRHLHVNTRAGRGVDRDAATVAGEDVEAGLPLVEDG